MIVDPLGRRFRNLRISLTAACNYACTYCVPDGKRLLAADHELSAEQMVRAVRLLAETAGIDKLRITGGEPLLSPKFDEVLPGLMSLGMDDVSITTNGQLVPRKADLIIRSGIRRMNVSLETFDLLMLAVAVKNVAVGRIELDHRLGKVHREHDLRPALGDPGDLREALLFIINVVGAVVRAIVVFSRLSPRR